MSERPKTPFRQLIERTITVDEYVAHLHENVRRRKEAHRPATPRQATPASTGKESDA